MHRCSRKKRIQAEHSRTDVGGVATTVEGAGTPGEGMCQRIDSAQRHLAIRMPGSQFERTISRPILGDSGVKDRLNDGAPILAARARIGGRPARTTGHDRYTWCHGRRRCGVPFEGTPASQITCRVRPSIRRVPCSCWASRERCEADMVQHHGLACTSANQQGSSARSVPRIESAAVRAPAVSNVHNLAVELREAADVARGGGGGHTGFPLLRSSRRWPWPS